MKHRETSFVICIILLLTPFTLHGQGLVEQLQKLDQLMLDGRYFESKELHQNIVIPDTVSIGPATELFYKFRMAQFLNKRDSLAIYLEKNLSDYYENAENKVNIYSLLFDAYIELGNKDKAMYTYERIKQLWDGNLPGIGGEDYESWRTNLESYLYYIENIVNLPSIKMKRDVTTSFVDIEGDCESIFQAKYNGILQKTFFDTGMEPPCCLSRRLAEGMGMNCDSTEMNRGLMNGSLTGVRSIIDSIEIGNITFYNIPAFVYNESESIPNLSDSLINDEDDNEDEGNGGPDEDGDEDDEDDSTYMDSIRTHLAERIGLGLPIMRLIGKIQTDYDNNRMYFPVADINASHSKEANIYVYRNNLYVRVKLNGADLTANLDTGSNAYLEVDSAFYAKHKEEMPIDTTMTDNAFSVFMLHQAWESVTYKSLEEPVIMFDNKLMQPPTVESIKIYPIGSIWPSVFFDGIIGYDFYRRIGKKVLLDFDNMRLEAVE